MCVCVCVCVCVGAIREVWRSKLKRQMSQRLAEERKAAEETKRFYNEDLPDEEAGEEAEFTDPDTSDEEFVQNEGEAGSGRESDACSDLDEQERLVKEDTAKSRECEDSVEGEGGSEGEGEGEEVGEEMDGYFGENESDSDDCFSDNEDITSMKFSRSSRRKKVKQKRLLDSEDEQEEEEEEERVGYDVDRGTVGTTTPRVAVFSEDRVKMVTAERLKILSSVNGACEEASMEPLALSESYDDNENSCNNIEGDGEDVGLNQSQTTDNHINTAPSKPHNTPSPPASFISETEGGLENGEQEKTAHENIEEILDGTSKNLIKIDDVPTEQSVEDEEEEDEEGEEMLPAIPDSDKDNSLENSLMWAQSLAPAQPWRDTTTTCGTDTQGEEDTSQWPGTLNSQRYLDTQNASIDEQSQFLDANGSVQSTVCTYSLQNL